MRFDLAGDVDQLRIVIIGERRLRDLQQAQLAAARRQHALESLPVVLGVRVGKAKGRIAVALPEDMRHAVAVAQDVHAGGLRALLGGERWRRGTQRPAGRRNPDENRPDHGRREEGAPPAAARGAAGIHLLELHGSRYTCLGGAAMPMRERMSAVRGS